MKAKRTTLLTLIITIACATLVQQQIEAQDYFTTNRNALGHFWAALENRQRPVTVVSFGDSMADSYRSVTYYVIRELEARFGVAGYSLNNYRNTELRALTNGAALVFSSETWFADYYSLPPGGGV